MDGMRRSTLIGQVIAQTKTLRESKNAEEAILGMHRYGLGLAWADLRATLHGVTLNDTDKPGRIAQDFTLEDLMALPDALVQLWYAACMTLNPQWAPEVPDVLGGSKQPETTSSES